MKVEELTNREPGTAHVSVSDDFDDIRPPDAFQYPADDTDATVVPAIAVTPRGFEHGLGHAACG